MARFIGALGTILLSAGCFPVCHHYQSDTTAYSVMNLGLSSGDPMRQNVLKATDGFPVVGKSTREEVLLTLGEPDDWGAAGRLFVYRWRMVTMMGLYGAEDRTTYTLHLVFDEQGTVQSSLFDSGSY